MKYKIQISNDQNNKEEEHRLLITEDRDNSFYYRFIWLGKRFVSTLGEEHEEYTRVILFIKSTRFENFQNKLKI